MKKVTGISLLMCLCLLLVMIISLVLGTADISFKQIGAFLGGALDKNDPAWLILYKIRIPRIILAGLVGFSLSLSGVVFQAMLRNPLADPFILGISSGGAFGAVLGIVFGFSFSLGVPVMSFASSLLAIYLLMRLGTRQMGMESTTILLTGVIMNAFYTSLIMFFISTSSDARLHTMLFWLYGDLSQSRFGPLMVAAPVVLAGFFVLYGHSRHLNLITSGEETALQLGVDVARAKTILAGEPLKSNAGKKINRKGTI